MTKNRIGKQTFLFNEKPEILGTGSVVGVKEGAGPLREYFDTVLKDDSYGEKTWEKTEIKMLTESIQLSVGRSGKSMEQINVMVSGDLLNQLMSASFSARNLGLPFLGVYGACSTMTESMIFGSILVDGGYADCAVAAASSHYSTAERQFRLPLEHGNQRPPSAQWTVTGSGSMVIGRVKDPHFCCTCATVGKIMDPGITDSNQMGAAMAPAAFDTMYTHFLDTGRSWDYYDMILTGDLGYIGKEILLDMLKNNGISIEGIYNDCGAMIYSEDQDVHGGGSGCGCSATVFAGYIYQMMLKGRLKRVLLISTGALLSPTSLKQGDSIPGIAHAAALEVI